MSHRHTRLPTSSNLDQSSARLITTGNELNSHLEGGRANGQRAWTPGDEKREFWVGKTRPILDTAYDGCCVAARRAREERRGKAKTTTTVRKYRCSFCHTVLRSILTIRPSDPCRASNQAVTFRRCVNEFIRCFFEFLWMYLPYWHEQTRASVYICAILILAA